MIKCPSVKSKVVVIGSRFCGRTTIIYRAVTGVFDPEVNTLMIDEPNIKQIVLKDHCVNLEIWDQLVTDFGWTLKPNFSRGANVVLFVFSLEDRTSFEELNEWVKAAEPDVDNMPILFVVGNKNDLVEERKVESEQAELFAKKIGAFYYEVSAKTGSGIEELFNRVAEESYNKLIHENNEPPPVIKLSNRQKSKCH